VHAPDDVAEWLVRDFELTGESLTCDLATDNQARYALDEIFKRAELPEKGRHILRHRRVLLMLAKRGQQMGSGIQKNLVSDENQLTIVATPTGRSVY
jgi:hypothetical protein